MGKLKAVTPIVLALLIAFAGSLFLYRWVKMQTAPTEVVTIEAEAVPVAVAAVSLPWGTKLKHEMMKTTPYLRESLPAGYCSECGSLEGRVLVTPLKENEPILESRLAPETIDSGGVSAIVPKGKRAIAVKGDKVIGISGFIRPGNRVDVLVTMNDPINKKEITKTVLENILILATGTQIEEKDKGEPSPVDVYTLEVTPDDAEKLSLAATGGRLQFALRNVTDTETVMTSGATASQTLSSYKKHAARKRGGIRYHTVEIIRDGKVIRKRVGS